ncbi:unnamed protein product [Pylaiella littoralis]
MALNTPRKDDRMSRLRKRAEMEPSDDESDGQGSGNSSGGEEEKAYGSDSDDYEGRHGDSWDEEEEGGGRKGGAGSGHEKEASTDQQQQPDGEQARALFGESIGERLSKLSYGAGPSRRKRNQGNKSGEQSAGTEEGENPRENARTGVAGGKGRDSRSGRPKAHSRANKNRPQEASSLRAVGRFREVVPGKRKISRDPRFEGGGGSSKLNYDIFRKAYGFLGTYQDSEIEALKKSLKKEKDQERSARLQGLLTRLQQERAERSQGDRSRTAIRDARKKEREAVAGGKKAFFLKGSEKKKLSLEQRYEGLKEEGKLSKFMEKKRKKNAAKDHRWLPSKRQDRG